MPQNLYKYIFTLWWNEAKKYSLRPGLKLKFFSTQGEISPRVERVTTYKCFFIERGNFTPGEKSRVTGI